MQFLENCTWRSLLPQLGLYGQFNMFYKYIFTNMQKWNVQGSLWVQGPKWEHCSYFYGKRAQWASCFFPGYVPPGTISNSHLCQTVITVGESVKFHVFTIHFTPQAPMLKSFRTFCACTAVPMEHVVHVAVGWQLQSSSQLCLFPYWTVLPFPRCWKVG